MKAVVARLTRRCLVLLAFALAWGRMQPAHGAVQRYALLIGVNEGHAQDPRLQFAESDVDNVAQTLEAVGGFRSDRIVRLKNATAEQTRNAVVDLNLLIQRDVNAGTEAVLFVYFSGHGAGGELHMRGTTLATEELSKLVKLSAAKLKLLMLDACRAGSLTRVKGGRQVAPFQIGMAEQLRNEGFAIITSSAAGEDAQESDTLQSSVFTHHFLGGLRGLADANRDGLVTLGEAYGYAYAQSLRSSMTTVVGSQHATFDYDLRGRADPVLANLNAAHAEAELVLRDPGDYLIAPASGPGALVEAHATESNTRLRLPAGIYGVRMRTPRRILQTDVALTAAHSTWLTADEMTALPPALAVRKGEVAATLVHGPSLAGSMHGPVANGFSSTVGAQLGWAFEFPSITVMPRFGLGRAEPVRLPEQILSHELTELSLDVAALYVFDLAGVSVAPLAALGSAMFSQTIERLDGSTTARPWALMTSVGAWANWPLAKGFSLETSAELAAFFVRRQSENNAAGVTSTPQSGSATYRVSVGLGYRY